MGTNLVMLHSGRCVHNKRVWIIYVVSELASCISVYMVARLDMPAHVCIVHTCNIGGGGGGHDSELLVIIQPRASTSTGID